jgi:hypothetical protein
MYIPVLALTLRALHRWQPVRDFLWNLRTLPLRIGNGLEGSRLVRKLSTVASDMVARLPLLALAKLNEAFVELNEKIPSWCASLCKTCRAKTRRALLIHESGVTTPLIDKAVVDKSGSHFAPSFAINERGSRRLSTRDERSSTNTPKRSRVKAKISPAATWALIKPFD